MELYAFVKGIKFFYIHILGKVGSLSFNQFLYKVVSQFPCENMYNWALTVDLSH